MVVLHSTARRDLREDSAQSFGSFCQCVGLGEKMSWYKHFWKNFLGNTDFFLRKPSFSWCVAGNRKWNKVHKYVLNPQNKSPKIPHGRRLSAWQNKNFEIVAAYPRTLRFTVFQKVVFGTATGKSIRFTWPRVVFTIGLRYLNDFRAKPNVKYPKIDRESGFRQKKGCCLEPQGCVWNRDYIFIRITWPTYLKVAPR
jgi:hypothetical protein